VKKFDLVDEYKLHGITCKKIKTFQFRTLFQAHKNCVRRNGTGTPHARPTKYYPP
jgi:hypothetical protein